LAAILDFPNMATPGVIFLGAFKKSKRYGTRNIWTKFGAFGRPQCCPKCRNSLDYNDVVSPVHLQLTFDAYCCHSLWYTYSNWASECPDVKNYKWRLNPVRDRTLCMARVGVKGLKRSHSPVWPIQRALASSAACWTHRSSCQPFGPRSRAAEDGSHPRLARCRAAGLPYSRPSHPVAGTAKPGVACTADKNTGHFHFQFQFQFQRGRHNTDANNGFTTT